MVYDLFLPEKMPRGLAVFVHGGYWRAFDKSSWSHLARGALSLDLAVAMPSYDLCPDVSIAFITQQIAQAVRGLAQKVSGPIYLAGHSAGGHLVARMLAPGMLPLSVQERVAHVMPISPLSDLAPLIETTMNNDFGLDIAMARAESPVYQPTPACPVTVWVGGDERPVFLEQAQALSDDWASDLIIAEGLHHFNVINALADPGSEMVRRAFAG